MSIRYIRIIALLVMISGFPAWTIITGQSDTSSSRHFVFPEYINGVVKLKDGRSENALMNYNMITEEMVFEQGDKRLALTGIENIDTVYLGSAVFVPHKDVFLEILVKDRVSLLIRHKKNMLVPGSPAGYGGTTETGATHSISHLVSSGNMYKLDLPSEYHLTDASQFWIYFERSYQRVTGERQLLKLFSGISADLKQYFDNKDLNFTKPADVTEIIKKCNELLNSGN